MKRTSTLHENIAKIKFNNYVFFYATLRLEATFCSAKYDATIFPAFLMWERRKKAGSFFLCVLT